jgi:hypothetical protein
MYIKAAARVVSRGLRNFWHYKKNVDTAVTGSAGKDRYWRRCVTFIQQTNYEREIMEQTPR